MDRRFIDPLKELGGDLLSVEKPARYVGGEYGLLAKKDAGLYMAVAFPDLYEIGMSNQALRIIYNRLNEIDSISCDRVFAPAPDFEALLARRSVPLYGLDTGIALQSLDVLGFTLGYELGITSVLAILSSAGIPLKAAERKENHPLVIMGGPCVSNPMPYSAFIDAFWIGEAEAGFFELSQKLLSLKLSGASRTELFAELARHPSVWHTGKPRAERAVYTDFAAEPFKAAVFPVPNMRVVQHHGAVEIMRGCPNGCRFCHAGFWYRPMRQKDARRVEEETEAFVRRGGYREISLSSLSSGDYAYIDSLVAGLSRKYGPEHISFQLPSLHVSTFSLPLLKSLSEIRKGGLTFAVETPADIWQFSINKEVSLQSVVSILLEAKKQGFRLAKFYFMVGLPPAKDSGVREECEIVDFIREVYTKTKIKINVNVGTFIPKPHTPYQRAVQLDPHEAEKKLNYIRNELKPLRLKVSVHDPFISWLEGIISRGTAEVGNCIEAAFLRGCRLDAWDEHFKRDIWKEILDKGPFPAYAGITNELAWNPIDSGITSAFLSREEERSRCSETTSSCIEKCTHFCGICARGNEPAARIVQNTIHDEAEYNTEKLKDSLPDDENTGIRQPDPPSLRILFSFTKQGPAVFLPHLSLIEIFSMAFIRAGLPVLYTQGFNPLPKLDIASPLSIGIEALAEIASVDMYSPVDPGFFIEALNRALPPGIRIKEAGSFFIPMGVKRHSVSALFWGAVYEGRAIPKLEEKNYRRDKTGVSGSVYGIRREAVLAKHPAVSSSNNTSGDSYDSYFTVYKTLYSV